MKTISSGIIPERVISLEIVCIIIGSAALSLFIANVLGIPLSTSEVTVGSVVGVGVAYQVLYVKSLLVIVSFWVVVPIVAFTFTFAMANIMKNDQTSSLGKESKGFGGHSVDHRVFEAFSAGMNNVANAVGPLVAAHVLTVGEGTLYGGLFVALGALLLGRRVLETNGKKITKFSKGEGIILSGTGAGLVIISSIFGLPVPLAQVTSSSIIGMGMAKNGGNVFHKQVVKTMLKVWVVSPFLSLSLSYMLVSLLLKGDYYALIVVTSVLLASVGTISLMRAVKKSTAPSMNKAEEFKHKVGGNKFMSLAPHGGVLVNRVNEAYDFQHIAQEIELDLMAFSDLELIGIGAYSPIQGFMTEKDYLSVVENMRLSSGEVWTLPIALPVDEQKASSLKAGDTVRLTYNGETYGVIEIEDIYTPDKKTEAVNIYKTDELEHPGVKKLFDRGSVYVGGPITLIKRSVKQFPAHTFEPLETRKIRRTRLENDRRIPDEKSGSQSARIHSKNGARDSRRSFPQSARRGNKIRRYSG